MHLLKYYFSSTVKNDFSYIMGAYPPKSISASVKCGKKTGQNSHPPMPISPHFRPQTTTSCGQTLLFRPQTTSRHQNYTLNMR